MNLNTIEIWSPFLWYNDVMKRIIRPTKIKDGILYVPVTNKGKEDYCLASPEDEDLLSQYNWHISAAGYVKTNRISFNGYMHRLIMKPEPYDKVDHINGNKHDNRRENLRVATAAQNQMNRHVAVAKSGYKGVWKHGSMYRAHIKYNGKSIRLGSYKTPEKAARAYNQAAIALFGEYANINKIKGEW